MTAPHPHAVADKLEALATRLRTHGTEVGRRAPIYAARGFPARTIGAGANDRPTPAPPPADPADPSLEGPVALTTVEAAGEHRHQFADIDARWDRTLRALWSLTNGAILLIDRVMAHADPTSADERRPRRSGSGACLACGHDCTGTDSDRLRSGYCDRCRMRWQRAGRPDRAAFERQVRAELAEPATVHIDPTAVGNMGTPA